MPSRPAPASPAASTISRRSLSELTIEDQRAFSRLPLYRALKSVLIRDGYTFRVLSPPSWDRALVLNLTYWSAAEGGDVLAGRRIAADVVTHVAWHHLAHKALGVAKGGPSVRSLFLGESIASAFDVYLMGHLLRVSPEASFLATQVPAFAEVARSAGMRAPAFERLLGELAADPEGAFSDLRTLLMDASLGLFESADVESAAAVFAGLEHRRFAPLLHHYELSTWVLHARAHGRDVADRRATRIDEALRTTPALDWLVEHWLAPGDD